MTQSTYWTFKNITQRIECFFEYDSQNWTTLFEYDSKNWTFLSIFGFLTKNTRFEPFSTWLRENEPDFQNLTQRIEPSSQEDSKNWTLKDYLIPTTKLSYDSRNWTFFCLWIKEIKLLFSNLWFKLLDLFWTELTELNTFKNMTRRTGPFWKIWLIEIEPFFSTWVKENDSIFDPDLKNISFSIFDSKNNDPFIFGNNDPKNCTSFFWRNIYDSKNWTFFHKI